MINEKPANIRQSLQIKPCTISKINASRDSDKQNIGQYSIDIQLSDNHKKVLEAFKQSSGFYNLSPKKLKSKSPQKKTVQPSVLKTIKQQAQCQRIYLFGNQEGDYFTKPSHLQSKTAPFGMNITETKAITLTKQTNLPESIISQSILTTQINNKHIGFLKQVLETLGLISNNDNKLQIHDLIQTAYVRFFDMKSSGRWSLIQKYFKGIQEDDLIYSGITQNKSIIKKKSMIETQNIIQKKKVKVVEPESASQLARTKYQLASDLQNQLQTLTKGFTFQKYCFNTQKIEQVSIYFSYDLKCIAWQQKDKQPVIQSMQNYTGVTDGTRSKNYQKYVVKKYKINEHLAFSLIFKNRTLDLLATDQSEKQSFIQSIKYVRSFI